MSFRRTASRSASLTAALVATIALSVSGPVASAASVATVGSGWTLAIPVFGAVVVIGPGGVILLTGITQKGGG